MGFQALGLADVFLVEDASQCTFTDVSFTGYLLKSNLVDALDNVACIHFQSTASLVCNNITFRRCTFSGTTWAFETPNQVQGVLVTESTFDTLYQGVLLGDPSPVNGGPTGFRFIGNVFDNIYAEGIVIALNTGMNASVGNMFYDVGNHFNGTTAPATAVISFVGQNNVSIGDMFQRTTAYSTTYPRIDVHSGINIAFDGSGQIQQGTYVRQTGATGTLLDNASNQTILTFNATAIRAVQINYTIVRDVTTRTGVYTIVAGTDSLGTNLLGSDSSVENATTGVILSVSESAGTVSWKAAVDYTGVNATITYSLTKLA